jgi:hypothetical protein
VSASRKQRRRRAAPRRARKIRITAKSLPWLIAIDDHVRQCRIRGRLDRFRDVAADVLDGWAMRSELADLLRRRLLAIVEYGFDDSLGPDPARSSDPQLCGAGWSVNPTERLIRALWFDRLEAA